MSFKVRSVARPGVFAEGVEVGRRINSKLHESDIQTGTRGSRERWVVEANGDAGDGGEEKEAADLQDGQSRKHPIWDMAGRSTMRPVKEESGSRGLWPGTDAGALEPLLGPIPGLSGAGAGAGVEGSMDSESMNGPMPMPMLGIL